MVKEMFLFVCFLLKKIYFIVIEEILSYIWSKWTVPPDRRTGKVVQADSEEMAGVEPALFLSLPALEV